MTRRNLSMTIFTFALTALLLVAGSPLFASSHESALGDFNGDGYSDLAVGVPGDTSGNTDWAGGVHVIYGGRLGLDSEDSTLWNRSSVGIDGAPEINGAFGAALVTADFNRDGYSDLAIGSPGATVNNQAAAGAVHVLYGSAAGLTSTGSQLWTQNSTLNGNAVLNTAEADDLFGYALAIGDFDDDGDTDLAIGAPGEDTVGAIHVLNGSANGLTAAGNAMWFQDTIFNFTAGAAGDLFGSALAGGDFNFDNFDDLAIGVPGDEAIDLRDGTTSPATGAVHVLYGDHGGLTNEDSDYWHQDVPGIEGRGEVDDLFGYSLAAGDFNGDLFDDLAIGVPGDNVGVEADFVIEDVGAVNVIYGWTIGLQTEDNFHCHQNSRGIVDEAERGENFGYALAAGDFDGNGVDDLAIGVPNQEVSGHHSAGAVHVLQGNRQNGLTRQGDKVWTQDSRSVEGKALKSERFGSALAVGDFNDNGVEDLAIGVPGEKIGGRPNVGGINVLPGRDGKGLTTGRDVRITQASEGMDGIAGTSETFGAALASGH